MAISIFPKTARVAWPFLCVELLALLCTSDSFLPTAHLALREACSARSQWDGAGHSHVDGVFCNSESLQDSSVWTQILRSPPTKCCVPFGFMPMPRGSVDSMVAVRRVVTVER